MCAALQRKGNLVSVEEVFPLAFTLVGGPSVSSLLHLRGHNLPDAVVLLRSGEVLLQLCTYSYQLSRLLMTPWRDWDFIFLRGGIHLQRQRIHPVDSIHRFVLSSTSQHLLRFSSACLICSLLATTKEVLAVIRTCIIKLLRWFF